LATDREPSRRWVIVAYDLPNEPSKLRVRAWRSFKKLGAVYPSVSLCILPDSRQLDKEVDALRSEFSKHGSIFMLNAAPLSSGDDEQLLRIFLEDRSKQYEELYEECQEFLDEIADNIKKRKTTYEETDELEQAFEGLERWFQSIKGKGEGREQDSAKVEKILEKCRKELASFAEKSQPKDINRQAGPRKP